MVVERATITAITDYSMLKNSFKNYVVTGQKCNQMFKTI